MPIGDTRKITGKAHGMCGICGAVWTDANGALAAESLKAMRDRLVHRGPDDAGDYRDDHAALGFRRLAIIDLAGGHQPLSNEDGTDLDGLQRRDLQLPCAAAAAGSQGARASLSAATPRFSSTSTRMRGRGCSRYCAGCSRWRSGMHPAARWSWPATGWARSRWSIATTAAVWSLPAS